MGDTGNDELPRDVVGEVVVGSEDDDAVVPLRVRHLPVGVSEEEGAVVELDPHWCHCTVTCVEVGISVLSRRYRRTNFTRAVSGRIWALFSDDGSGVSGCDMIVVVVGETV